MVENFFKPEKQPYHEIGMYYRIELPEDSIVFRLDEQICKDGAVTLRFKWFPLADIERLKINPAFLKKGLLHLPNSTRHLIWNDE